jgi:uncharacterized protein YyaL (SSP411 family)
MAQAYPAAGMKQLSEHRRALFTTAERQSIQAFDDAVAAGIKKGFLEAVARVYRHALHDDQTHAAARARQVIGDQVIGYHALAAQRGAMRGVEDAITQPGRPEGYRLQQAVEHFLVGGAVYVLI